MRRFLIFLALVILLAGGAVFWLADQANKNPPNTGEQRIEVELDV
tara:strand:+ start:24402 stop:24536 length:135 start_codon:yes stop_codon:yes gene_type:complete